MLFRTLSPRPCHRYAIHSSPPCCMVILINRCHKLGLRPQLSVYAHVRMFLSSVPLFFSILFCPVWCAKTLPDPHSYQLQPYCWPEAGMQTSAEDMNILGLGFRPSNTTAAPHPLSSNFTPHTSDAVWLDLQAMTAGFEASSRQMKSNGKQGSMVTLALVCGHHVTVATASTSQAHLDTGS